MPASTPRLTDDEGAFLALLLRVQPATAYQLAKIYEESPVSNFGTSKGKIYPLIRRLKDRGLMKARPVAGDARGSEELECTRSGRSAVKRWVREIRPTHVLLDDPLRTKVQSFDLLSPAEQLEWILEAQSRLQEKMHQLQSYGRSVTVPYKNLVHDNAMTSVRARLRWLQRVQRNLTNRTAED